MPLENPLTPPERRAAVRLVAERDQVLADRLEVYLSQDEDPLVATLRDALKGATDASMARMDDMVKVFRETATGMRDDARARDTAIGAELRATRFQVVCVVALALILMAALVGVGVVYRGQGISFSTSASAAQPSSTFEVDDVVEADVAGPSPAPAEPQF